MSFKPHTRDRWALFVVGIVAVYAMATTGPAETSRSTPTPTHTYSDDPNYVTFGAIGALRSRPGVSGINVYSTKEAVLIGGQNELACRVSDGTYATHIGGVDGVDHALRGLLGMFSGQRVNAAFHTSHVEVIGTRCSGYVWDLELRPRW